MKPAEFWEYSIAEVYDIVDSYLRREKAQAKQQIEQQFVQAEATARWVAKVLLGDKAEAPKPWEYYPKLFEGEQTTMDSAQQQSEIAKASENRKRYAEEFNRRRRIT